jgi:hypothetical protein
VGNTYHTEWSIPAEDWEALNDAIVGRIEIIGGVRHPSCRIGRGQIDPPAAEDFPVERLVSFVREGGTLVAFQTQPNAYVERLAQAAGSPIGQVGERGGAVFSSKRIMTHWGPVDLGAVLEGLQEVACQSSLVEAVDETSGARRCVLGVSPLGKGQLILGTQAALITDTAYGSKYSTVPNEKQRILFELEYELFDCILQTKREVGL